MSKTAKKTIENTETTEPEENEEYLTYTWTVGNDLHIEFHNCHDIRIMSGQPSQPPPKPPGGNG